MKIIIKQVRNIIVSAINETNEMFNSKSFAMSITISSPSNNISPVIDTQRLSLFLIQNRMFSPSSNTTPDFRTETTNTESIVHLQNILQDLSH